MDQQKTGALIRRLRQEQKLTQRQLAQKLGVGDKAVSKWERGLGCPDVGLLPALAKALNTGAEQLLRGALDANETDGGNMKRIQFYFCPQCGNLLTATAPAQISCCGRPLAPLTAQAPDDAHRLQRETVEDELYLTSPHAMAKDHYLAFVALAGFDRVTLVRLYPEQNAELRLPQPRRGRLYWYCTQHGLFTEQL